MTTFAHNYNLGRLGNAGDEVRIAADEPQRAAIAGLAEALAVPRFDVTVTLTKTGGGGFTAANAQTLLTGMTYQNTDVNDPTTGNRVFTVTSVSDSGGTSNGGVDTATGLGQVSTVAVTPRNDAPTLTGTGSSPTFTEAAGLGTQAAAVTLYGLNRLELMKARYQTYFLYMSFRAIAEDAGTPPAQSVTARTAIAKMSRDDSAFAGMIRYFEAQPTFPTP